jgi:hypothetical protein
MSPLRSPSAGGSAILPQLDVEKIYVASLEELEERPYQGPQRYNDKGKEVTSPSIVWKFSLFDPDSGKEITRPDGTPWQLWAFTSDSTFFATPPATNSARARLYMHALAGRDLDDAEVDDLIAGSASGLPEELIGQQCLMELRTYQGQNGDQRYGVDRLKPYRGKASTRPAPRLNLPLPAEDEVKDGDEAF